MNRPALISVFSDQRRTKSTTRSRTSCGTHTLVRAPQDFFLRPCAQPSIRPAPHPSSGSSFPGTRSVVVRLGGPDGSWTGRQPPRSRRTLFANGRTPWAAAPVHHIDRKPALYPASAASERQPSLLRCSAFALFACVLSVILTEERSLQFHLRRDTPTVTRDGRRLGTDPVSRSGRSHRTRVREICLRPVVQARGRAGLFAHHVSFRPAERKSNHERHAPRSPGQSRGHGESLRRCQRRRGPRLLWWSLRTLWESRDCPDGDVEYASGRDYGRCRSFANSLDSRHSAGQTARGQTACLRVWVILPRSDYKRRGNLLH